jgi:hypothetical protein
MIIIKYTPYLVGALETTSTIASLYDHLDNYKTNARSVKWVPLGVGPSTIRPFPGKDGFGF